MAFNYEYRFEIKPDRWVYIQTEDAKKRAESFIKTIRKNYTPNEIFYGMRRHGGHVSALHAHRGNLYYSRFDIDSFFWRITRSRIVRALRSIGIQKDKAFNIAYASVVQDGDRKHLPFGFRQSPLIATLALEKSLLGKKLISIKNSGICVTAYVDDIIISSNSLEDISVATDEVIIASKQAELPLSAEKMSKSMGEITAFNCNLAKLGPRITEERLAEFVDQMNSGSPESIRSILNYISAISADDIERLTKKIH